MDYTGKYWENPLKITEPKEILTLDLSGITDVNLKERRILSRILATGNQIAIVGQRGPATHIEVSSLKMVEDLFTDKSEAKIAGMVVTENTSLSSTILVKRKYEGEGEIEAAITMIGN